MSNYNCNKMSKMFNIPYLLNFYGEQEGIKELRRAGDVVNPFQLILQ